MSKDLHQQGNYLPTLPNASQRALTEQIPIEAELAFHVLRFQSPRPGPRLIVTAAVHGNETHGSFAIQRIVQQLISSELQLLCGHLSLVPVTNPKAWRLQRRQGDRNLNRRLMPCAEPLDYEDHVANWLCPLLKEHDGLLDLHSFQSGDQAFALFGPSNNQSDLDELYKSNGTLLLEEKLNFDYEISVMVARSPHNQAATWPATLTIQSDGICTMTVTPISDFKLEEQVQAAALKKREADARAKEKAREAAAALKQREAAKKERERVAAAAKKERERVAAAAAFSPAIYAETPPQASDARSHPAFVDSVGAFDQSAWDRLNYPSLISDYFAQRIIVRSFN